MSLRSRRLEPELMDDPELSPDLHDAALDGLARLNRVAGADLGFRRPLARLLEHHPIGEIRLLDLATGSGDLPVRLDRWLGRTRPGLQRHWQGVDISQHALERAGTRAGIAGIEFQPNRLDVLREPLPPCDIAMCSLFLHHLDDAQAAIAIRRLDACARIGVIVGDLRRTHLGLILASGAARLLTRSPIVHADAPASVRAAFADEAFERIVREATPSDIPVNFNRAFPQRRIAWWRTTKPDGP